MKTRNGLISNSSSTSFIVAYKPSDKCPHCGKGDPELKDIIEQHERINGDKYNIYAFGTKDDLIKYFQNPGHWWDSETIEPIITQLQKVLEDRVVLYFAMSAHDDVTRSYIDDLVSRGLAEYIYEMSE